MTTPSPDRGAVSVEPMTDADFVTMQDEIASLGAHGIRKDRATWSDLMVARLVARCASRALPSPRRYTGGPLEDGLYLWRREWWPARAAESIGVEGGVIRFGHEPPLSDEEPGGTIWLIGPIHIPPIPESEEAK